MVATVSTPRGAQVPVWVRAREYTVEALGVLAGLMRNAESEAVRATAANSLLDRAWGKAPVIVLEEPGSEQSKVSMAIMSDAQVAKLEAALGELLAPAIQASIADARVDATIPPVPQTPASDADKGST